MVNMTSYKQFGDIKQLLRIQNHQILRHGPRFRFFPRSHRIPCCGPHLPPSKFYEPAHKNDSQSTVGRTGVEEKLHKIKNFKFMKKQNKFIDLSICKTEF